MDTPLAAQNDDEAAVTAVADTFQTEQVLTIAGAHFVHDTYSAFLAPLLPLLQERLAIGYALAGGLTVFSQLPSLLNPFLGYLADKISLRYFIILAPAFTATFMSVIGLTSNYVTLIFLMLAAGVTIAAFHAPAPAMVGRVSGLRIGKGMSIFMASGELGRSVGPVVAVAAVGWFGLEGIWRLAFVGWAVSGLLYFRLRHVSARPLTHQQGTLASFWPGARAIFPLLIWIMSARVFMLVAVTTYLPVFMRDARESSLWLAAASLTILEAAGVVGALATGTLSDRFGRPRMLAFLMGIAPLLLLLFLYSPNWLIVPLLLGLGLTAVTTQPVMLALVQDEFPQHRALANGTFLAFNFLIRAGGVWAVGWAADQFGLSTAFLWSGVVAWASLPAVLFLARRPAR
ncbi:MAG: MFS transporter [Chloroflexota bacterium]|nr:MFS transporter [Anaerolineales bacterium]MCB8968146.1 MFS transporter [Ardenticatenaceae bacterium]